APGIEKDQQDEHVDRALLREPEAELETAEPDAIQLIDQQDAEAVRADEPRHQAGRDESQVGLPVGVALFGAHAGSRVVVLVVGRSIYQSANRPATRSAHTKKRLPKEPPSTIVST